MSETQAAIPAEVSVTLLLAGGQQFTIQLATSNLLLRQLFEALVNFTEQRPQMVFQIPLGEGKGLLCFPSDRLIGVITDPPLVIQQQTDAAATAPIAGDSLLPGLS